MPRVAELSEFGRTFPWDEWEKQLVKAPTGALVFGPDDFGEMPPAKFRDHIRRHLAHLDVRTSVRGKEVLVALNA